MNPEIEAARREAPSLDIRIEGARKDDDTINHGKLIVVDGLVAVSGSSNFNHQAWRKASDDFETITVDTSVDRVRELNNRHFSSHWLTPETLMNKPVHRDGWTMTTPLQPEHSQFSGVPLDLG
jgi:hypothetical protein